MAGKDKDKKKTSSVERDKSGKCPAKEGDNCLVPGVFSDSEPIGGGG